MNDTPLKAIRDALELSAVRFREYEQLHRAKLSDINSPKAADAVLDKAMRNREMAEVCEGALALIDSMNSDETVERVAKTIYAKFEGCDLGRADEVWKQAKSKDAYVAEMRASEVEEMREIARAALRAIGGEG